MNPVRQRISRRRRFRNGLLTLCCWLTASVALTFFVLISAVLVYKGGAYLSLKLLTQTTPAPLQTGGLQNAIVGSLIMTLLAILIAAPTGILIATFLTDFGDKNKTGKIVRFVNDLLLSTPSIIIGLFAYGLCVLPAGHFSGFAGVVALIFIALPMIIRSSEDVLYLVSPMLKESALALGIPRWRVTISIVYRVTVTSLITGSLLALARIAGETAPLLFTALNSSLTHGNLLKPMASLPVVIYQFALSPYKNWQHLAWAGALLITATVLLLNLTARFLASRK